MIRTEVMTETITRAEENLPRIVSRLLSLGRGWILGGALFATSVIAAADWYVKTTSLGGLYMLPMLLTATVLPAPAIILVALLLAVLRCTLDDLDFFVPFAVRLMSSWLSYGIAGVLMAAVIRSREVALQHVTQITREQQLRNEAEERLKTLVESSPAAIFTLNQSSTVVAANHAANVLFGLEPGQTLEGRSIGPYMPVLSEAVRLGNGRNPFRTEAKAQGRRENGEIFFSDVWFSTYNARGGTQLAAIAVDSSEEVRNREEQSLQQLSTNSRLVMAAVLHEVRNLCSAISIVYSNLSEREEPFRLEEIRGLGALIRGLGWIASLELDRKDDEELEAVLLPSVLDDLRIIVEPKWQEIGGSVSFSCSGTDSGKRVLANRYGLMQVFMNLAQNSHRAVQTGPVRNLAIEMTVEDSRARVNFFDTGCGIADPQRLFQPFQENADVTGLGLFISRAIVRSYGGELMHKPVEKGCCFVVELPLAGVANA